MKSETIQTAIENAFQAEIANLFKTLFSGFITANDNPEVKKEALARFTKGLSLANEALQEAEKIIQTIPNCN